MLSIDALKHTYSKPNVINLYTESNISLKQRKFDFLVIGSGAGGAVVAKELAERGATVALFEEGDLPFPYQRSAFRSLLKMYRDSGFTGVLGKPTIPIPLGCCVGGTTVINSGTCFRVPQEVLDYWNNELRLTELLKNSLDPYYEKVEKEIHVEEANWSVMNKSSHIIKRLLEKGGYECRPLRRNTEHCEGCGMCCYGCTSGAKKSMELSYIPRGIENGMYLFYNAKVKKILVKNGTRGVGIIASPKNPETHQSRGEIEFFGNHIIVACGTLHTPSLLHYSGIATNNQHLGKHLTIHPASKVALETDEDINSWQGIPQACYTTALDAEGIKFEGVAMPPDLGLATAPFFGQDLVHYWANYAKLATFGFMIKDSTEGKLVFSFLNKPFYVYQLTAEDVAKIKRAIVFLAELALENGIKRVYVMAIKQPNILGTLSDIERFMKTDHAPSDFECMAFHPLGTCRMGQSPIQGVCDENHKVFGTDNIYVCDGSVIPTALGVNPQLTIMALATRLATLFE